MIAALTTSYIAVISLHIRSNQAFLLLLLLLFHQ